MRLLRIALTAFLTGFSGAMMPGPMLALTVGQVAAQGFVAVPLICAGHAVLELVTVVLLLLGLRAIIARPAVRGVIGLMGGAALLYMGTEMVRSAAGVALALESHSVAPMHWAKVMVAGAAVCAANPYFLGWWATVGAGQLAQFAPKTAGEYLSFYLGHGASDLAWYSLVGVILVTGRSFLSPGVYQGMILVCGALIAVLGTAFVWTGIAALRGRAPAAGPDPGVAADG
ncbi:MAG: lysine transporter LysE [Armatimonadetes bacterium CG_4_10_14_3_um_filter_66_18]|nr:LysE family transporter [Armatimonadota bacterium]PIU93336.1 MAG: lysine transporter LysE [Armatimonadetes bacterium CG06_land_8_20_14_3_00_66_21]PIY36042.1 MAG: lysine transporter LysE [Armatimonadetes bacterium CG_4_10_14_3_um_filter_66_18]PJB60860.1 MAG: lysine transporter LysE [Armatimonadetes bacterium CG_4_9_14_3_um_filter_66_14]